MRGRQSRFFKRQLVLPVSTMSQWWVSRSSMAADILGVTGSLVAEPDENDSVELLQTLTKQLCKSKTDEVLAILNKGGGFSSKARSALHVGPLA